MRHLLAIPLAALVIGAAGAASAVAQDTDQRRALALLVEARGSPAVQAAEREVEAATRSAMLRLDEGFAAREARSRALGEEVARARQDGDNAKLNLLAGEAEQLRAYFADLRQRAGADPMLVAARQRLEEAMMARMTELDPEAPALIARVRATMGN